MREKKLPLFELPKGRISSLRQHPIKEFIDGESGSPDVLLIKSDANVKKILEAILSPKNREDAVIVVKHKSKSPAIGIIADVDFLEWIENTMKKGIPSKGTASQISKKEPDFFHVKETEPLQKAIDVMKERGVTHVVVLDEKKNFVGWVTKRSILRKMGAAIGKPSI